jgi:hypothetical protein
VSVEKLTLLHQGVDLARFQPRSEVNRRDGSPVRVLIYSRLDLYREPTIWRLLEELESSDTRVTLLGEGEKFWNISDRFGTSITLAHFMPCTSIQNFLPTFDVVISSARGIMESLATDLPAICGGYEYAGPVLRDNIQNHLTVNITGYGMGIDPARVKDDVKRASTSSRAECRQLAEDFCSVQAFIDGLLRKRVLVTLS